MATERDVMAGAPQRTSEAGRADGRGLSLLPASQAWEGRVLPGALCAPGAFMGVPAGGRRAGIGARQ